MGSKLVGWAWDAEVPPLRKLVLLALAERATDDNGLCAGGSVAVVSSRTGLSRRSVQRHVAQLGGLVEVARTTLVARGGGVCPGPNRYRLRAPWITGAAVLREDQPTFVEIARRSMARKDACLHSQPMCEDCRNVSRLDYDPVTPRTGGVLESR